MKEKPTVILHFWGHFSADPRVYIGSKNHVILVINILSPFHPYMGIA
jgi:hypothetical protein